MTQLLESVECPSCGRKIRPSFKVCTEGHLVCPFCKQHQDNVLGVSKESSNCHGKEISISVINKMFKNTMDYCQFNCGYRADLLTLENHEKTCPKLEKSDSAAEEMMLTMLTLLECIICTEVMETPIRNCENGHSFCGKCSEKMKICAICSGTITQSRNYILEQVSENLNRQKSISENRVRKVSQSYKNEEFSSECVFYQSGKYCDWKGTYKDFFKHWKNDHTEFIISNNVEFNSSYNCNLLINFCDGNYIFTNNTDDHTFYFTIFQLNPDKNYKFFFDVTLLNKDSGYSITYQRQCLVSSMEKIKDTTLIDLISDEKMYKSICRIPKIWFDYVMRGNDNKFTVLLNIYRLEIEL